MSTSNINQLTSLMSHENEIGTPNKPPRLATANDYINWRGRFESFVLYNDPELMDIIVFGYDHPTLTEANGGVAKKNLMQMSEEEKKTYHKSKKAYAALTMGLSREILQNFKAHKTAKALWDALEQRYAGNDSVRKSKKDLLKTQWQLFTYKTGELLETLLNRYTHLLSECHEYGVVLELGEINEKLLYALPSNWDTFIMMTKKQEDLSMMTIEDLIGLIQAQDMDMQKRHSARNSQVADPTKAQASASPGSIAFFSGSPAGGSFSQGGGSPGFSGFSGSSSGKHIGAVPSDGNIQVAQEQMALFACFMTSYQKLALGELVNPDLLDDNLEQISEEDMEEMDLRWQMAMLTLRAKRFFKKYNRTGFDKKEAIGFDKSRVKCYNCHNFGHFARDCQKPRTAADDTRQSSSNASRSIKIEEGNSKAMVVQSDATYDWTGHSEEVKNQALMAEISSDSNSQVNSSSPSSICSTCLENAETINRLQKHNGKLVLDINALEDNIRQYREKDKLLREKLLLKDKDVAELARQLSIKETLYDALTDRHNKTVIELDNASHKITELNTKMFRFDNASNVATYLANPQHRKGQSGVGFNSVPPPFNGNHNATPFVEEVPEVKTTAPRVIDPLSSLGTNKVDSHVSADSGLKSVGEGKLGKTGAKSCLKNLDYVSLPHGVSKTGYVYATYACDGLKHSPVLFPKSEFVKSDVDDLKNMDEVKTDCHDEKSKVIESDLKSECYDSEIECEEPEVKIEEVKSESKVSEPEVLVSKVESTDTKPENLKSECSSENAKKQDTPLVGGSSSNSSKPSTHETKIFYKLVGSERVFCNDDRPIGGVDSKLISKVFTKTIKKRFVKKKDFVKSEIPKVEQEKLLNEPNEKFFQRKFNSPEQNSGKGKSVFNTGGSRPLPTGRFQRMHVDKHPLNERSGQRDVCDNRCCFHCGRVGHVAYVCPVKFNKTRPVNKVHQASTAKQQERATPVKPNEPPVKISHKRLGKKNRDRLKRKAERENSVPKPVVTTTQKPPVQQNIPKVSSPHKSFQKPIIRNQNWQGEGFYQGHRGNFNNRFFNQKPNGNPGFHKTNPRVAPFTAKPRGSWVQFTVFDPQGRPKTMKAWVPDSN